jgi:multicomponent K+:H+ antiporter subunit D
VPETKYGGETIDPYAYIPDVISDDTLQGEHISEYKNVKLQNKRIKISYQMKANSNRWSLKK